MRDSPNAVLATVWGYASFRENQQEVIRAILNGRDVFTSMPTGGGKSLCYQIPSLLLEGLTVVVSPLIALMKDQVDDALGRGIPAAYLNSTQSPEEIASVYDRLYRGELKLLYLAPERLAVDGYAQRFREFGVSLFAIDEAHCLSEWGHDFRPDYLFLAKLRGLFPGVPIAAFTATATQRVQEDIIRLLGLKKPLTVRASFNRQELSYQVIPKTEVLRQIGDFVKNRPDESGIIYRLSRKDVEQTAAALERRGIRALPYHAGLDVQARARNQELFNNDEVQVICATVAFGMGINKNNVRYVLHGDLPKSVEGYYQETGRAGRDGLPSTCLLLYGSGDIVRQRYFIDKIADPAEAAKCSENLQSIARLASLNICRRKQLLEYFGEAHQGDCGNCDICIAESEGAGNKIDASVDAQKILSAVARVEERFGANHIIDIVIGANTEKIRARGHNTLKTYGVGHDKSRAWWRSIVAELLGQEAAYQDGERFGALRISPAGREILYGRRAFLVRGGAGLGESTRSAPLAPPAKGGAGSDEVPEALLKALKSKRTELARKQRLPPYVIFSDKTLRDMAILQPQSADQFLMVQGVGQKKLETYGEVFMQVLREYRGRT